MDVVLHLQPARDLAPPLPPPRPSCDAGSGSCRPPCSTSPSLPPRRACVAIGDAGANRGCTGTTYRRGANEDGCGERHSHALRLLALSYLPVSLGSFLRLN